MSSASSGTGTQAVLINIDVYDGGKKITVLKNKLERVVKGQTFIELFIMMSEKCESNDFDINDVSVYISNSNYYLSKCHCIANVEDVG